MGGLGGLAAWQLPGGPVGPPSRWAATSNVDVHCRPNVLTGQQGQGSDGGGKEWCKGQSQKEEENEGGRGTEKGAHGSLAEEGELYLDIYVGVSEFLVTPLLMGPVCLLSWGQFEEPVRSCLFIVDYNATGAA